jgi:hypothetical protein
MSDNEFIRRAHQNISMTDEQTVEFVKCCDPVDGYRYFMTTYFYIQHPTKGKLLYDPYEFQDRLIDNYHANRFSISMMPRQTGKCLTESITITIRNNITGKQYSLPIGLFYEFNQAKRDGTTMPEISGYEIKSI